MKRLMSNGLSTTIGGMKQHVREVRDAQRRCCEMITKNSFAFTMRFEVRFLGTALADIIAEDPPKGDTTWASAAHELMRNMTAILFWFQFQIWDIKLLPREGAVESISIPSLMLGPSMHLAAIETALDAIEKNFATIDSTTLDTQVNWDVSVFFGYPPPAR